MSWYMKLFLILFSGLAHTAMKYIYGPWSRAWRYLFERKYTKRPLLNGWTPSSLNKEFKGYTWKSDYLGGLLDVISKPERFYETKQGDCDEFAAFGCMVLTQFPSHIMSVTWYNPKKKLEPKGTKRLTGHNVCLFLVDRSWWHIGNWGLFGPLKMEPRDVALTIVPTGAIPIAYSLRTGDAKLKWTEGGPLFRYALRKEQLDKGRSQR